MLFDQRQMLAYLDDSAGVDGDVDVEHAAADDNDGDCACWGAR